MNFSEYETALYPLFPVPGLVHFVGFEYGSLPSLAAKGTPEALQTVKRCPEHLTMNSAIRLHPHTN
jgi:hypothetical protein